jgi:hypothetical protein
MVPPGAIELGETDPPTNTGKSISAAVLFGATKADKKRPRVAIKLILFIGKGYMGLFESTLGP